MDDALELMMTIWSLEGRMKALALMKAAQGPNQELAARGNQKLKDKFTMFCSVHRMRKAKQQLHLKEMFHFWDAKLHAGKVEGGRLDGVFVYAEFETMIEEGLQKTFSDDDMTELFKEWDEACEIEIEQKSGGMSRALGLGGNAMIEEDEEEEEESDEDEGGAAASSVSPVYPELRAETFATVIWGEFGVQSTCLCYTAHPELLDAGIPSPTPSDPTSSGLAPAPCNYNSHNHP